MSSMPMILEGAIAAVIKMASGVAELPRLRLSHSVNTDPAWSEEEDRVLPVVTITASEPEAEPSNDTLTCLVEIEVRTHTADDQSQKIVSGTFNAIRIALDSLYAQMRHGIEQGEALHVFTEYLTNHIDPEAASINIGGLGFEDSAPLMLEDETYVRRVTVSVYYSRSDW